MNKNQRNYLYCMLWLVLVLPLAACGQTPTTVALSHASAPQATTSTYPVTIKNYDTMENPVSYSYEKAPARVVITHPGATELFLELGLEDRILSTVSPYGAPLPHLAEKYAKLTIMTAQFTPSQEELLEMQPDLIIGWAYHFSPNELGDVKSWQQRGIGTYIMPSTLKKNAPTLDNTIYACITDLGEIFGIQDKTSLYIENYKKRVAMIEEKVRAIQQPKSVIILQDYNNGTFSLYDSHYLINTIVAMAGGKNLCSDQASFVGAEKVLSFDPDYIIYVSSNRNNSTMDLTDEEATFQLKGIKELQSMRAIREKKIINLPFFTVNNGGIRTIDTLDKIARHLYPEEFQDNTQG